jgi:hypothetical protein
MSDLRNANLRNVILLVAALSDYPRFWSIVMGSILKRLNNLSKR